MSSRWAVGLGLGVVALALVAVLASSGGSDPRLHAVFNAATNVTKGMDVRASGVPVGKISAVEVDGDRARLELRLSDREIWPLPERTTASLRWGGQASFGSRYVDLEPGPGDGESLADGALIEVSDTTTPVEIDRLLRTFPEQRRRQLRRGLRGAGGSLGEAGPQLQELLEEAPPALKQTEQLLADIGADPEALRDLITGADRVLSEVNDASPGVGPLASDLAATFDATASEADGLERTLARLPGALDRVRATLARANSTLERAESVTSELGPALGPVRSLIDPAEGFLRNLAETAPIGTRTLRTLRVASPDLRRLLARIRRVSPDIEAIGGQGAEQVACIRPYTPEIAGTPSTWTGWLASTDAHDGYGRIHLQAYPYPAGTDLTPEQITSIFPGLNFAFPRPPGQNVGDPWLIPECGVGPEALDPAKDPEASFGGSR